MSKDSDRLDTIFVLIKQLETTLLGLRHLRGYVGKGVGLQMLEVLIEEGEAKLAEVRKRLVN
jgi:hypothetical protein